MAEEIFVNLEFTPNPNSLKFSVNRALLPSGAAQFKSKEDTYLAPLARAVFAIAGIESVMVGVNFVTITKAAEGNWDQIAEDVPAAIKSFLESGVEPFDPAWFEKQAEQHAAASSSEGDVARRVREILDNEIRPAVAMDGGDITFDKYEDGKVYLHLQGACSSCPSSIMTLKMGVESRLKDAIPEIQEVVQA